MDNDVEISDDNDDLNFDSNLFDLSPFPSNCEDEIYGIKRFHTCFMDRYNACPGLFLGSLRNACEQAFNSPMIKEHYPILVYIHHDRSLFSNIFCLNIFSSDIIINYLLENYIVWPWDITYQSNRNILIKIWNEIFSIKSSLHFSMEECPMLIGIMRQSVTKKTSLSISEYKYIPLLKGDSLIRTKEKFSLNSVLNELSIFKEECNDNEQALSCEVIMKTGFCEEIIVEICKYLSLNDAINTFSIDILLFLRKSKSKVHIVDTCETYLNRIIQKLKPEQIVSLYLNKNEIWLKMVFASLSMFNQIISLTLLNLQYFEEISEYKIHFPNITCLSLRYNNEIGLNIFKDLFIYLPNSVKRFEIHCPGILCTHYDEEYVHSDLNLYDITQRTNYSIKYFLLDLGENPLISVSQCFQQYKSCFFITIMDLMKSMRNIHYFYLIINQYDLEKLIDVEDWEMLKNHCYYLKKIILKIKGNILENEQLSQKILEIQKELCDTQPMLKFRIIFT